MAGKKKALVIGCRGQDGSLLCKSLLKKNYCVIGSTRDASKEVHNHVLLGINKDILIKECETTNLKGLIKLISDECPDQVYNLAAQSSVGRSLHNPNETIESIVNGTINILEACREINYNGRLFFAGSSEIFGNTEIAADINHRQSPNSPYGMAKQTSLNLVKFYREMHSLKCYTGILFNHESPLRGEDFVTRKIISGAIRCSKNKNYKLKLGNLNISRDWGWAEEYMEAIQLMNKEKNKNDQVICTGRLTSLVDFVSMVFEKLSLNYKNHVIVSTDKVRKVEIYKNFGNPKPFYDQFKWKAKLTISDIIENLIVEQLKSNKTC